MSGKAATFGGRLMRAGGRAGAEAVRGQLRARVQALQAHRRAGFDAAARERRPAPQPVQAGAGPPPEPAAPQRSSTAWPSPGRCCKDWLRSLFGTQNGHDAAARTRAKWRPCSRQLARAGYIAEPALAAALLLMQDLERPLLLEGDAGVGKTEVAKVLAAVRGTRLIRLQCYEGLDAHAAMYEWNYQRQLLAIKLLEHDEREPGAEGAGHLLRALPAQAPAARGHHAATQPPVLLIDEVDRADEAFEAYLLELLSDFQLSIPELGTVRATSRPLVVITSNGTRELSDALRRRCLYQYIDYPDHDKELAIVRKKAPQARGRAGAADRGLRAGGAAHGPAEEARHRRDAGLDRRAAAAGHLDHRRRRRRAHHATRWAR